MKLYKSPVLTYDPIDDTFDYIDHVLEGRICTAADRKRGYPVPFACGDIIFELWDVKPTDRIVFHVYDKPGPLRHKFCVVRRGDDYVLHFGPWTIDRMYYELRKLLAKFYSPFKYFYVECEIV